MGRQSGTSSSISSSSYPTSIEEPLKHFDEDTAIHVENIQGHILFIYAKEDLMWPSKRGSGIYGKRRLEKHRFAFRVDVLEYEKASHILVPLKSI